VYLIFSQIMSSWFLATTQVLEM